MFDPLTAVEVWDADPDALADDDLTAHLLATIAVYQRAAAAVLAALGAFDARGQWALDGAVGPAPWLAARAELSIREARGLVGAARSLRRTSAVASALADGSLNVGQAKALASVRTARTEALFDAHEDHLVDAARSLSVDDTIRLARRWQIQADTDGPPPDDDDQTRPAVARLRRTVASRRQLEPRRQPDRQERPRTNHGRTVPSRHRRRHPRCPRPTTTRRRPRRNGSPRQRRTPQPRRRPTPRHSARRSCRPRITGWVGGHSRRRRPRPRHPAASHVRCRHLPRRHPRRLRDPRRRPHQPHRDRRPTPSAHDPRRRMRLPRLRPAARLVPGPPHPVVGTQRSHRSRQPVPALQPTPPRTPPAPLQRRTPT